VTFDTPVDDEDQADVDSVVHAIAGAFPHLKDDALVLVSSQVPVGTSRRLEGLLRDARPGSRIRFASSPENLRLGRAIDVFTHPDRIVAGVRSAEDRDRLTALFQPITDRIEWMSVESAEMTKHAINAFLGMSVAFINEIAGLAEQVGADARDVERGLKTERRIGPLAYLAPGAAFAGGTLARDVNFLRSLGQREGRPTPIMDGVRASNLEHRSWTRRRLARELGTVAGRTVTVWGLTYKPGTDTLRRSEAIELARWLVREGASVRVHDPAVTALPEDLSRRVRQQHDPIDAAQGAHALVVATEWPVYRQIDLDALAISMPGRVVIDANRFLAKTVGRDDRFRLLSVGSA
jgi:UDPglucose 6-dehydrogenase